jgi:hypothetical protein
VQLQRCSCRGAVAEVQLQRCSCRGGRCTDAEVQRWCRAGAQEVEVQRWRVAELQRCRGAEVQYRGGAEVV